jgi:hypothetical protein
LLLFCLDKHTQQKCQLHCFETWVACDYKLQLGEPILSSKIKTVSVYAKCPFCYGAYWRIGREGKGREGKGREGKGKKEVNGNHWEAEIMERTDQTV